MGLRHPRKLLNVKYSRVRENECLSLTSSPCLARFCTTHAVLGRESIHVVRGLSLFPSACKPHNGILPYPAPPSLPCLQQHPAHSRSSVKTHGITLWIKKQEHPLSTRRKSPNLQFPQFPAVALCGLFSPAYSPPLGCLMWYCLYSRSSSKALVTSQQFPCPSPPSPPRGVSGSPRFLAVSFLLVRSQSEPL